MIAQDSGSFYVPHDIEKPVIGAEAGPLAGLTVAVKDMYDIAGSRTGGGSPEWLARQEPALRHAAAVQKLLEAGAIITGKTICEELFYSMVGVNAHYGMPANVRAPGRIPGGSSSGSAAAVGAGACDIGLGSDTAGSIRIPASFNGVWGLRVSHGRMDMKGAMAMAPTFDAGGWMAAGPGVLQRTGLVLLDKRGVPEEVREVVFGSDTLAQGEAGVVAACHKFMKRARKELPLVRDAAVLPDAFADWCEAFRVLQAFEVWETFGAFVREAKPDLGPGIKERVAFAASVKADEAAAARKTVAAARREVQERVPPGVVIALPTSPAIAPKPDMDGADLDQFRLRVMRLTSLAGLGGLPQITIPMGTVAGAPVGFSFIDWHGGDEALLALGVRLAKHCGVVVE